MEKAIAKRPIEVLKEKLSAKSTMETLGNALRDIAHRLEDTADKL